MRPTTRALVPLALLLPHVAGAAGDEPVDAGGRFRPMDVFDLELASDPRLSPDGSRVAFVRSFFDVTKDRRRSNLWIVDVEGKDLRPLTTGDAADHSPRWSPDGGRLAYVSSADGSSQIWVRWMDTGATAELSRLERPPSGLSWSPDGRWIAFSMHVAEEPEPLAELASPPEGAEWAPPPRVIRSLRYRSDGAGYLEEGNAQIFVLPAEGGTPRQLTRGPFDHRGEPQWTPDGRTLVLSANRRDDAELDPLDTEVYALDVASGELRALTDRRGPDGSPVVSPDGSLVAYLGFDDRRQGYQLPRLSVVGIGGGAPRVLAAGLDREIEGPRWRADGRALYFQYDDQGDTRLALVTLEDELQELARGVGGLSLGRPYSGGSFHAAGETLVYTGGSAARPADLFLRAPSGEVRQLTRLNDDLLGGKRLAEIEELRFTSSHDGREIQGWLAKPPGFDPARRHPLLLEIHGGPFACYGPRFAAEIQLFAAAGYLVLYVNPRGSTGYGEEFANLIHHAYPGHDYDDLMSGVDAVLARGWADPENLFVTGGSGGGVLTSWIVGRTDRFRAAVVAKPVINWTSFVLTSDEYAFFWRYWFPGYPWEHPQHYWERSPLSLVGSVVTPTMLLTGEADHRTPISESEQLYQALRLRGVDTALVRFPEASHGIADRPSHLIAKAACILAWFEEHRSTEE